MERDFALAVLQREAGRVLALVTKDEEHLELPVTTCPDWTLDDLVKHLGNVYNWAGTIVEGRLCNPPDRGALPRRPDGMSSPDWMADRLDRLTQALAEVPGDAAVWTFSGLSRTAAFWWRRQAQETLVHRVDAEAACEMPITSAEPDLAADTVSELFEILSFDVAGDEGEGAAGKGSGGASATSEGASRASDGAVTGDWPASVHLHATDLDGAEWTIDTAARSVSRRHSKAEVALRGPAFALARWCWGRPAIAELDTFGDVDAAERWRKSFAR